MGQPISRRTLLAGTAGVALAGCAASAVGAETHVAHAAEEASLNVFDLHADTIDALGMVGRMPYAGFDDKFAGSLACTNAQVSVDRMGDAKWVQCYAIWLPDDSAEGDYQTDISHIQWYREAVQWFKGQMETQAARIQQVRKWSDIDAILAAGKVAAVLTVENAACLDEGIGVVDEFAADGVMIAGLTWNGRNVLGSGNNHVDEGLSDLGRAYVGALEDHGIVVDVSHLNDKGFWELDKIATKPYVATHSNARSVCNHPRNLTNEQFSAIMARGGLVGLNFNDGFVRDCGHAYTFEELAAHVDAWLELGGEDVIALGADRDGAEIPTWIADCANQGYLYRRFCAHVGKATADKLFYKNAMAFFGSLGA